MSLHVWLPLTKDLRNQGLDNVTITNNGATFNSAGKLGGCYNCDGEISVPYNFDTTNNNYSISFWYYYPLSTGRYMPINTNSSGNFCIYFRDSQICLNTNNNGNNNRFNYTVPVNIWNHYCIVVNNNTWKLYVNGIDYGNSTTTLSIAFTNFTIGSSRGYGGKINDVRIYDHCLSPMEVKQLAQGLVLHYPLNRQGWGQENLILDSNIEKICHNNIVTYDLSTEAIELVKGKTMRISADIKSDIDNAKIDCYVRSSANNAMCSNTLFTGIGTSYKRYTLLTTCDTNQDKTPKWFAFRGTSGGGGTSTATFNIKNVKLELGEITTPWCPNSSDTLATTMGLNSTTEYDCSGFCNNGNKITNTITYTSDTAKYAVSTHFNGTYDGIIIENLALKDIINSAVTYAFWIKPESESGARSVYFGSYNTGPSWSIEKTTGNVMRSFWNGSPDETCSGATITDGVWQHVCITKSGTSDIKVYINGIQKWNSTATHSNLNFPTTFRIGRDTRSNDGTPYKGLMSDFRIYATALSAEDVKSLYQNSAYIDSSGNIYGAVHAEV